jgi:hypothetical protein
MSQVPAVTIVPANEASWEDLQAVFGARGESSRCLCQRYKTRGTDWDWATVLVEEHAHRLRLPTGCGPPESDTTSGLVAYLDGEPTRERGACALEGYPMITQPGKEITWGELHVGSRSILVDAGFAEVSHPTLRRVVMRIDF